MNVLATLIKTISDLKVKDDNPDQKFLLQQSRLKSLPEIFEILVDTAPTGSFEVGKILDSTLKELYKEEDESFCFDSD